MVPATRIEAPRSKSPPTRSGTLAAALHAVQKRRQRVGFGVPDGAAVGGSSPESGRPLQFADQAQEVRSSRERSAARRRESERRPTGLPGRVGVIPSPSGARRPRLWQETGGGAADPAGRRPKPRRTSARRIAGKKEAKCPAVCQNHAPLRAPRRARFVSPEVCAPATGSTAASPSAADGRLGGDLAITASAPVFSSFNPSGSTSPRSRIMRAAASPRGLARSLPCHPSRHSGNPSPPRRRSTLRKPQALLAVDRHLNQQPISSSNAGAQAARRDYRQTRNCGVEMGDFFMRTLGEYQTRNGVSTGLISCCKTGRSSA